MRTFARHKAFLLILSCLLGTIALQPVTAQTTPITGVINAYAQITAIDDYCLVNLTVPSSAGFKKGDAVMIIQMKGASIDNSNSTNFGNINSYASAGNYELNTVLAVSPTDIALTYFLTKTYDPTQSLQIVTVPSYKNATVTGTLTAAPWDGTTGGVLAFEVSGTLKFNAGASINVNGTGFQKGDSSVNTGSTAFQTNFYYAVGTSAGNKGEGIAVLAAGYEAGRGADANGGGGGNGNGAGGGGGGNYGTGGNGGGQNYLQSLDNGGLGGRSLTYSNIQNRIFLGGGGGGGFQNNACGTSGGRGGGIVIIRADSIVGNGATISSIGTDGGSSNCNDGTGGGGAGGTILLDVPHLTGNFTINTSGGNGGNNKNTGDGPGGSGAGGILWISGGAALPGNVTYTFNNGKHGVNDGTPSMGLSDGQPGGFLNGLQMPAGTEPTLFDVDWSADTLSCSTGSSVKLNDVPSNPNWSYSWSPSTGLSCTNCVSPIASPTVTTIYFVTGSYGPCFFYAHDTVTVIGGGGIGSAGTITALRDTICSGTPASLTVTGNSGTVQWQSSATQSSFTNISGANSTNLLDIPAQTIYYREYVGGSGCADTSAPYKITVKISPLAFFKNDTAGLTVSFNSAGSTGNITAYDWDFGDGATSTVQNPSHTFSRPDTFHVCLTVYNGSNCSYTLCRDVLVSFPTGVTAPATESNWSIYPNPASEQLTVISNQSGGEIEIKDVLGRSICWQTVTAKRTAINISRLPAGVYFASLKNKDGKEEVKKFVKE